MRLSRGARPSVAMLAVAFVLLAAAPAAAVRPGFRAPFIGYPLLASPGPPAEGAIAIADLDSDGALDAVCAVPGDAGLAVFRGRGDGTFGEPSPVPIPATDPAVVIGDLDADGHPDLVAIGMYGPPEALALLGDGAGGFETILPIAGLGPATTPLLGHLNGDSHLDLLCFESSGRWVVLDGIGDGRFEGPRPLLEAPVATGAAIADLDRDGELDLVLVDPGSLHVLPGLGNGEFGPARDLQVSKSPRVVRVVFLDGNDWPDLVVTHEFGGPGGSQGVSLLVGLGGGAFDDPRYFPVEQTLGAGAVGDFTGDGVPDVAVAAPDIVVLPGSADGTFGDPIPSIASVPVALAAADLDLDGALDLVAAEWYGAMNVHLGNGNGTFGADRHQDYPEFGNHRPGLADLDDDGRSDLVVASTSSQKVLVYRTAGTGAFQPPLEHATGLGPQALVLEDLDRDGRLDLAVANVSSNSVSVLLGLGGGSFAPRTDFATGISPQDLVAVDLDRDGRLDLVTANTIGRNVSILRGGGDGSFAPPLHVPCGNGAWAVAAGDLDRDGWPDLAVVGADRDDRLALMLNDRSGSLEAPQFLPLGIEPLGVAIADLDGDGRPDVLATHRAPGHPYGGILTVRPGNGDGTLGTPIEHRVGAAAEGIAVADLDQDGLLDVAVACRYSNAVSVLFGTGGGALEGRRDFGVGGDGPRFVSAVDLDGDTRIDLAAGSPLGAWLLLREPDAPTPVQVVVGALEVGADEIRISWRIAAPATARILRRESRGAWAVLAIRDVDGSGVLEFRDRAPRAGAEYDYALEIDGVRTGEVHAVVPGRPELALRGLVPNPGRGSGTVAFTLPGPEPARLDLVDVRGRRVLSQELRLGPGEHRIRIGAAGTLAPGLYWLRLVQGSRSAVARACVIE